MRKLILLFAAFVAVLSAKAEETRPVVETAPGETSIYRADLMAARSLAEEETKLNEICYRINFFDGKAYIYNLFSVSDPVNEYVVADMDDENIYIPTGFVYRDMEYAVVLVKRFVKDSQGEWKIDDEDGPVVWSIGEDGKISENAPDVKIGLVFYFVDEEDDPGMITCIFDEVSMVPAEITNEQLPENVTEYSEFRRYVNYEMDETYTNSVIKVARDGNSIFFKGLYGDEDSMEIECWIKGTLNGDVVTIPSRQLVGIDRRGYFCYNAKTELDWESGTLVVDDSPVTFSFDNDTQRMATEDWLLVTQGYEFLFLYFPMPELTVFNLVEATPTKPVFILFDDEWFDYSGKTSFVFLLPYEDTEGNFIDPEKMSFSLFLDSDEPYVFEPEQYPGLMEPVSEFGFYEINNYVFCSTSEGAQRHLAYFTTNSFEKVGVQSYYNVNGKRMESPILWYDRIGTSVKNVENDKAISHVETYDLMGRKVDDSAKGVVIRQITYTDGTVKSVKEIIK